MKILCPRLNRHAVRATFVCLLSALVFGSTGSAIAQRVSTQSELPGAPTASQATQQQQRLHARVSERWEALIAGDPEKAYSFFSPAYRALFSLERYRREQGKKVDWISIAVADSSIVGDRAKVDLVLRYRLALPPGVGLDDLGVLSTDMTEVWLWKDGDWWYASEGSNRL